MRRSARTILTLLLATLPAQAPAAEAQSLADWPAILADARGETVYWNAWGGSDPVNGYIEWVGERVADDYGIELVHVKLADTADAVARVVAEKAAGRDDGGSVDLIWINGENFAAMKSQDLLFGPFATALPNFVRVDVAGKPTVLVDFTVPTDGFESPWGMAQIVFYYDTARVTEPPRSIDALLTWAEANPGRFAYPAPPEFHGSSFLKQVLHALIGDPAILATAPDDASFESASRPLWDYLDRLTPLLWRGGRAFPQNEAAMRQLLDDGEIDIAFSFNPGAASSYIEQDLLPDSVRSFVLDGGTIGNTHFVAIPYNASARAGALVVANFLLSPEAQLRKQDPAIWGDPTVLAMDRLDPADRNAFERQPRGIATLSPAELGPVLPEPHPAWMIRIEEAWRGRYGS